MEIATNNFKSISVLIKCTKIVIFIFIAYCQKGCPKIPISCVIEPDINMLKFIYEDILFTHDRINGEVCAHKTTFTPAILY